MPVHYFRNKSTTPAAGVILFYLILSFTLIPAAAQVNLVSSNWPIILIDTAGKQIQDLVRIPATMKIIYNGRGLRNNITDTPNNYNGRIDIELRGSSSISYPKKSYRFETVDAAGNNLNVMLLGMPKENDWILYGPYDDQSLIRNVLAYRLSNDIGRYATRTKFCEVLLNNSYIGLYVMMEKIKQDKNRINITEMKPTDVSGDAVTGGYMIKIDREEGENVGGWTSQKGVEYEYHEPKPDDMVAAQKNYIQAWMNQFESSMTVQPISSSTTGYPLWLDVASFVDHFILSEFCKNIDAYRLSTYMFKDRDSRGGKLNAGPIWDFNLSLGKAWYAEDQYRVDAWEVDHNIYRKDDWPKVPFWWEKLGHDAAFAAQVQTRWTQLRATVLKEDSLFKRIDLLVDSLSEARARNFSRWPETAKAHSYEQEIIMLKNWISARIKWIEKNLGNLSGVNGDPTAEPSQFLLQQNYPNPFYQNTVLSFYLPQPATVAIRIYNLCGQLVEAFDAVQNTGYGQVALKGRHWPAGVYLCRCTALGSVRTVKLVVTR